MGFLLKHFYIAAAAFSFIVWRSVLDILLRVSAHNRDITGNLTISSDVTGNTLSSYHTLKYNNTNPCKDFQTSQYSKSRESAGYSRDV